MKVVKWFCGALFLVSGISTSVEARDSWLPRFTDSNKVIRLLECRYRHSELGKADEIDAASGWNVASRRETTGDVTAHIFTFRAKHDMENAGVAVAFDRYGWTSDNYVMIPASVYNGNRQRIVNREYATGFDKSDYYRKDLALTSNPIPQLSPEFGALSRLELTVCNAATPAIVFFDRARHRGVILLTDQGRAAEEGISDHGLIVEETPDRSVASFVISAPGVRERKPLFIGFGRSPDRGMTVKKDETVEIHITEINFPCRDVPELLARFMKERKSHTKGRAPRNLMPMSEVLTRMMNNIDQRYLKGERWEYYCPENADWMSYGWIGGLMNTFPMLALGDGEHLRRVKNTFDFALPRAKGASGYYYDHLGPDGEVIYRDGAALNPGIGLTRRNGDVLYWMVKQFILLREQGKGHEIDPGWEENIRSLADAFVTTWEKHGTWGNYIDVETGDVAVYNSTSGTMAAGGLALASVYYDDPSYLRTAIEAAGDFYDSFSLSGFTSGGCADILQNADSETAAALMTSLITLHEVTGEGKYLDRAKDAAHLVATWTVSFPYRLPADTPLARLGANLTGAVWASTQNKHGAPGLCTQSGDALFRIYRATGDTLYAELLRDIVHAHAEGIQPNGKITERLTYCDADSRGGRGDGDKTGWNETNGAMMALEIPGIYLRRDMDRLYTFDHVEVEVLRRDKKGVELQITNPTAFDASVSILVEDALQADGQLGLTAFLDWPKTMLKAGETVTVKY